MTLYDELTNAGLNIKYANETGGFGWADGYTPTWEEKRLAADIAVGYVDPDAQASIAARRARIENALAQSDLAGQLSTMTPQQAVDWADGHITDLASAKAVLLLIVRLIVALFHLAAK